MDSVSFFWSFVKMLFSLAVVIGLMVGALWVVKRYLYKTPPAADGAAVIRVVASHPLGPKHRLLLVDVLGQIVLLGVSGQQVSTLATLADPLAREILNRLYTGTEAAGTEDPWRRGQALLRRLAPRGKDR